MSNKGSHGTVLSQKVIRSRAKFEQEESMLMGVREGRCSDASRTVGCDQRRPIWPDGMGVMLLRGRTIARSLTEAETRVGVFARDFLGGGCGAITNQAALPHEQTARGRARQTARWTCARRHPPRDERRDQRQPKRLGDANRDFPRHARLRVRLSAARIGAMREAKRPVERVNLLKLTTACECRPRRVRSQCG
jgi:hypothetical protein